MRLRSVSAVTSIGALAGFLLLLVLSVQGIDRFQANRAQLAGLIDLHQRIDSLSMASDSIVLFGADPGLWKAYTAEAQAAGRDLLALEPELPQAAKAAYRLEALVEAVAAGVGLPDATGPDGGGAATGKGAPGLEVPPRSRIVMNQIAGHGVALDAALDDVVRARSEDAVGAAAWTIGLLAGAGVLFALLAAIALGLVHYRIAGPVVRLSKALARIQAGDLDVRAAESGGDELAELAHTLNHMLDYRHASELRLRQYEALVENSKDPLSICDSSYRYLLVNRAYAETFGLASSAIEGRYLWDVLGQSYFDEIARPHFDRCLAGRVERYETERQTQTLGPRQLLVRYFPVETRPGEPRQVIGTLTDVTELKQTEARLREQGHLLEIAGRVGRFGGWSIDLAAGTVYWSDLVAEIHGMPIGHSPSVDDGIGFYAPECRDRLRSVFTACAEHGVPYDEELQIIDAQGHRVWVRAIGEAVRDAHGHITRVEGAFQDISGKKNAEREARALAERLRATLESITDAFFTLDPEWRFSYLNGEAERLLKSGRDELVGTNIWEAFPQARGTAFEREYRRAIAEQESVTFEEYFEPLGAWYEVRGYPSPEGLAVYFRDVSERRALIADLQRNEQALRLSRDRLVGLLHTRKALIDSLPASIALLDADGDIVAVNERWRRFGEQNAYGDRSIGLGRNYLAICEDASGAGSEEAPAVAKGLRGVMTGERDSFELEYPCHAPNGEKRWFRLSATRLESAGTGPGSVGFAVMHVDITERMQAELRLEHLAYHDPLTGLLSLTGLTHEISQRFSADALDRDAILVMLDVRNLRDVNDAQGYALGDQLLTGLGRRLQGHAGPDGLVGRVGGDEFGLYLRLQPGQEPHQRAAELSAVTEQPFALEGAVVTISINIGYTRIGEHKRSAEELLREAEVALFEQRAANLPTPGAYTHELGQHVHQRVEMVRDLRIALEQGQLELHFQPKIDLETGRVIACEALLRWRHPERGLQPPGVFIPTAEQSQLIVPIGDWVLREACRHLSQWQSEGLGVVRVAVNVSLIQLVAGDFPQHVHARLDAFDVRPGALTLEITESVFERDSPKLLKQLKELKAMGLRLSLDDFGTGYSSLAYLQKYPFDEIKIDRAFVSRVIDDAYSREVVSSVLGLAAAIGAEVVAEGIETKAVCTELSRLGCRTGQGYYFSMPLEAEDFRWLLQQRTRLPLRTAASG